MRSLIIFSSMLISRCLFLRFCTSYKFVGPRNETTQQQLICGISVGIIGVNKTAERQTLTEDCRGQCVSDN
ncbi:hypothetical protein VNO77_33631 [Canavalia gladiata]|uniref:Secreted protein n=1 Tax=Canavalia gladiata TaxID=3824 RepID=A0AAN9KG26_CANGL